MGKRVLKRFLSALGTSFFVIIFNFFLFRILPGDLTTVIARSNTSPEVKQRLIEASGLDKPLMTQFGIYIKQLLHGDLGSAFYMYDNSSSVLEVIVGRIPNTVILLLTAEIISIIIGMIIGTICAHKRATPLDTGLLSGSLVLYSMPTFWFAMLLIFIFCVNLRLFPTGGIYTAGTAYHGWMLIKDYLKHMALPSLCILTEDYIQTARAKGFSTRYILLKHAIPNAMLPMATIIAMNIAFILGGAIQLETLFSWKGLGQLMYLALDKRDFPMLQGCFLISTLAVILANFIMDILYGFIDPRVKE